MGLIKVARKTRGRLKPLTKTLGEVETAAGRQLVLATATTSGHDRVLSSLLGGSIGTHVASDGLLVHAAGPDGDHEPSRLALARHKAAGGKSLVVLIGRPVERARMEATYLAGFDLELSDVMHVDGLAGPSADAVLSRILDTLGDDIVAACAADPRLRDVAARHLIVRASRRSAAVGAVGFLPGAELPVLLAQQVRLVSQLAALHGRPLGRDRALELAGVVAAGFGWRGLARTAIRQVPGARLALRGGVAYAATRSTGEAALRWFASDASARPLDAIPRSLPGANSRRNPD